MNKKIELIYMTTTQSDLMKAKKKALNKMFGVEEDLFNLEPTNKCPETMWSNLGNDYYVNSL